MNEYQLATISRRFGAFIIDLLIISMIIFLIIVVLEFFKITISHRSYYFELMAIITYLTYFTILEASEFQATLGKMLFRLKTVDLNYQRIFHI